MLERNMGDKIIELEREELEEYLRLFIRENNIL